MNPLISFLISFGIVALTSSAAKSGGLEREYNYQNNQDNICMKDFNNPDFMAAGDLLMNLPNDFDLNDIRNIKILYASSTENYVSSTRFKISKSSGDIYLLTNITGSCFKGKECSIGKETFYYNNGKLSVVKLCNIENGYLVEYSKDKSLGWKVHKSVIGITPAAIKELKKKDDRLYPEATKTMLPMEIKK